MPPVQDLPAERTIIESTTQPKEESYYLSEGYSINDDMVCSPNLKLRDKEQQIQCCSHQGTCTCMMLVLCTCSILRFNSLSTELVM